MARAIADWLGKNVDDFISKADIKQHIANGNDELWNLGSMYISDMTGFEIFNGTDLKVLNLYGNNLTSFDARGLTNLERLGLAENQLTSVNVSGLTKLTNLGLRNNPLGNLNVSGLTNLERLNVADTELTTLNLTGLNKLKSLFVAPLTAEGITGLPDLSTLEETDLLVSSPSQETELTE